MRFCPIWTDNDVCVGRGLDYNETLLMGRKTLFAPLATGTLLPGRNPRHKTARRLCTLGGGITEIRKLRRVSRQGAARKNQHRSGSYFLVQKKYQNFNRLSCGQPWSDRLEQALITLGRLAGKG